MKSLTARLCGVAVAAIVLAPGWRQAMADQFYATQIIPGSPFTIVGESQDPLYANTSLALGGPVGGGTYSGSADAYNLGVGGSLTLGFDNGSSPRVIRDQAGPDFIVFENAFYAGSPDASFAELMYVEVSSNGVDFARFPVTSNTAKPVPADPRLTIDPADVSGFAGVHPVIANVNVKTRPINAFDPAVAGGDAFDLSALANDPLVVQGKVNLNAIRRVRLVDVIGDGRDGDRNKNPIYDAYGADGSGYTNNGADVDAVAVINGATLVSSAKLVGAAGGTFNDGARWDTGVVPSGAGVSADVSALGPGVTLSIAEAVRLGHLQFGSNSNKVAGPAMLTLDGAGVSADITATSGVHTISAPMEFSGDVVLSAGDGTIVFTGPLIYDDNTSITIVGGTVEFAVEQGPVSVGANVVLTVMGGATLGLGGNVDPLSDSNTGQSMAMSYVAVPEPGAVSCVCLFGCVLLRRRR